ncbi:MAG: Smr/MutS family endonuclease [Gammaproteobacteria bacterium]|nr:Smr/MutS family endonuclease [Gammaproteobacteria bacterium]MDH3465556.1 Smr/MutS family endonuclease [Gammaproteobacteria bacterium]
MKINRRATIDRSNADLNAFRDEVGDVSELKHNRAVIPKALPAAAPLQTIQDQVDVMRSLLRHEPDSQIECGEELLFARSGLKRSTFRRMRSGDFALEAELDLHGYTSSEARVHIIEFLNDAQAHGWRCVRIIHGKGLGSPGRQPILKSKLNSWLKKRDEVLAFASARPEHGGTGAVYVLLKKPKPRRS